MACARTTVNTASYNCRGFNDLKVSFITKLFSFDQFVCLQEHCLRDSEFLLLYSCMSNHIISFHACSGMADRESLIGRPYGAGGLLFCGRPMFSKRRFVVKVTVNNCSFVLINVYFPNDNFLNNVVTEELRDVVDSLETFMFNVDADFIVIAGGF